MTAISAPGSIVLATFALGMGLLFFVVGQSLVSWPKSGRWTDAVKSVGGIALDRDGGVLLLPIAPELRRLARPGNTFALGGRGGRRGRRGAGGARTPQLPLGLVARAQGRRRRPASAGVIALHPVGRTEAPHPAGQREGGAAQALAEEEAPIAI